MERILGAGRSAFWLIAAVLAVVLAATLGDLPPVVASHFDGAGAPNAWSSRGGYAGVLLGIGVLLPLAIVALVVALTRNGPGLVNIPTREQWSRPEHSAMAVRMVRAYMWWVGAAMAGIALAVHLLVLRAHTVRPPRLSTVGIVSVLVASMVVFGLLTAGWQRLFRTPPGE